VIFWSASLHSSLTHFRTIQLGIFWPMAVSILSIFEIFKTELVVLFLGRDALASLTVNECAASAELKKKRSREDPESDSSKILSPSDISSASSPSGSESSKGGEKARRLSPSSLTPESVGSRDLPSLNFTLPMYTSELGSFPAYDQFHFTDPTGSATANMPAQFFSNTGTANPDSIVSMPNTMNANFDSLMFDHFTPEASIPPIPPTADTYVIDALFHSHGQPQAQSDFFPMAGFSQDAGMASHLDLHSGLAMSSFGMDFADFSEFQVAGASNDMAGSAQYDRSSGFRTLSGLNNETIVLWDDALYNTQ